MPVPARHDDVEQLRRERGMLLDRVRALPVRTRRRMVLEARLAAVTDRLLAIEVDAPAADPAALPPAPPPSADDEGLPLRYWQK